MMRYATSYDVGDDKRPDGINEDSVCISVFEEGHREGYQGQTRDPDGARSDGEDLPANRSGAAFALADGAGGHEGGDVASYVASTVACEELAGLAVRAARSRPSAFDVSVTDGPTPPSGGDVRDAIRSAILAAHRAVCAEFAGTGTRAHTTLVAGVAVDGSLDLGWVGDSRAYVVNRDRGDIARLTRDHSVVERLQDREDIDDVEAIVHPRGNEITRALGGAGVDDGGETAIEVDTRSVPLYGEDVVVVTSDGLVDAQTDRLELFDEYVESDRSPEVGERIRERVVTDDEIRDVVLDADSLAGAATDFVTLANDRGGRDNVSTLLFRDPTLPGSPDGDATAAREIGAPGSVARRETVIVDGE